MHSLAGYSQMRTKSCRNVSHHWKRYTLEQLVAGKILPNWHVGIDHFRLAVALLLKGCHAGQQDDPDTEVEAQDGQGEEGWALEAACVSAHLSRQSKLSGCEAEHTRRLPDGHFSGLWQLRAACPRDRGAGLCLT